MNFRSPSGFLFLLIHQSVIIVITGNWIETSTASVGPWARSRGGKGYVVFEAVRYHSIMGFIEYSCKCQIFSNPVGWFLSHLSSSSSGSCRIV